MNIKQTVIKKHNISIVLLMAMLILILTGCKLNQTGLDISDSKTSGAEDLSVKEAGESGSNDEKDESYVNNEPAPNGIYNLDVALSGGSGKAKVKSPTTAEIKDGKIIATIEWSSSNYDYMLVDGQKYLPVNEEGNSIFLIPISSFEDSIEVVADTVAMGTPHEIQYELKFSLAGNEELALEYGEVRENSGEKLAGNEKFFAKDNSDAAFEANKEVLNWLEAQGEYESKSPRYARGFQIFSLENAASLVAINNSDFFLVADKGYEAGDLPECITYIERPLNRICIVSSASMDYFISLDALDTVSFTSIKKEDVDNEKLIALMEHGAIQYTGKYSEPDYERLLAGGCRLVVENTMISHSESVLDQLHKLGMKTLIDYSSQESSPLGRMEWIKVYGILTGREEQAEAIFDKKEAALASEFERTGKSLAYFYITDNGGVVVRKNQDYIAELIELAGGKYILDDDKSFDGTGTMTIQKEDFFKRVLNCDYLIYNSTIVGDLESVEDLIKKCSVLKNTKAYREGHIYCTADNIYQSVMELPEIASDINAVIIGDTPSKYLYRLK